MESIKMLSFNTRGLGNQLKRRKIFKQIRDQKVDLAFLQEVHGTNKSNFIWSSECGNRCLFANGTSSARGVAILFNKRTANKIEEIHRDINGRFLVSSIKLGEYSYCCANIYASNEDNPDFFEEIFNIIEGMNCTFVILGGDFMLL